MYISRVRLVNIRGFSGPRNVDLTLTRPDGSHAGWTVLAGRNGSGKTSLLQAIALAVGGADRAHSLVPDFQNWVTVDQREAIAEVHLHPDASDYLSDFRELPDEDFIAALDWSLYVDLERPVQRDALPALHATLEPRVASGPWNPDPLGWFCAAYGPFRRLVGGAESLRAMFGPGPVARLASLFHEEVALTEGVQWLINQHLRALEKRREARELKDGALRILADGLLPDQYTISDVDSDGLWVISDGQRFPLREMSDGYRTVAALVVDLIKQFDDAFGDLSFEMIGDTPAITWPGVVIIDEVDAHLHVSWQKRIGGWLKAHFPNIQFIVTSHSPYICQAADEGGLIRLPGPNEQEPPRVVEPDLYRRIVFGSGDDAVLSELFGLDSPYSEQAEQLRRQLAELELKVVRGDASEDEISRYQALRRRLASSPAARVEEVTERLRASIKAATERDE